MKIQKILCPLDFSRPSVDAVRYAGALASHFHAAITVIHVARPVEIEYAMTVPEKGLVAEVTATRNLAVRRALDDIAGDAALPVPVRREFVEGEPAEEIVRFAQACGHDLIVMPSRGSGAFTRLLMLGSVTTKVLQAARCPVIAAMDFSRSLPPRMNRILCALDLGEQSARVLCLGKALTQEFGGSMTIAHATPGGRDSIEDYFDENWRATLHSRVRQKIEDYQRQAETSAAIVVEAGEPYRVIADVASRMNAGLIVAGRGVATGLIGRLRAQAHEIIRHSPCPVLSI